MPSAQRPGYWEINVAHYLLDELQEKLRTDSSIWDFLRVSCLDGMWYWDLENPEHEWMSPEFWELFGCDPATKEHAPESWFDIIHPEDKVIAVKNFNKHLADPDFPYDQVVRYRHAEGHMIWVRCRGLAVRDEEGRGIRMLGAHTDLTGFVTESMERERATQTMVARLSAVFNAAQSAIIGLDAERNVVTLNPPARQLLGGVTSEDTFPWPDYVHFLDSADFKPLDASSDPVNRALAGARLGGEVHLLTRDAQETEARYVRISSAQVDAADTDVHTVIVLDDVSEQEKNRQQIERQSRLDALGQLTGGIAHDFNNLLSTILYAISLVKQDTQTARAERLLNESLKTIERGRNLTGRLLAFAKQKPDTPSHQSIQTIFTEFEKLITPTIEEQVEIVFAPIEEGLSVLCDQHMLDNALLNLVLNSRDAIMRSNHGNRIILAAEEVRSGEDLALVESEGLCSAQDPNRRFVKFVVSDNGPGMDAETRRRATDPFFSTKKSNSGTGLGLSMVFGFVQQSGGKMHILSEPGEGTTVSLILPAGVTKPRTKPADAAPAQNRGRGEFILLAEDETALLSMMKEQLENKGYQVAAVSSGVAALQLVQNGLAIDALVSDVVMPGGLGGFELVRRVREIYPNLPAILMSGYAGYSDEERRDLDAAFLQKPCMPEVLDATLREVLSARREVSPSGTR